MNDTPPRRPSPDDPAGGPATDLDALKAMLPWSDLDLGMHTGPGWVPMVAALHRRVTAVVPTYEVMQVKEKLGLLEYYIYFPLSVSARPRRQVRKLTRDAKRQSAKTCDQCGSPGKLRTSGYVHRTRCDTHEPYEWWTKGP